MTLQKYRFHILHVRLMKMPSERASQVKVLKCLYLNRIFTTKLLTSLANPSNLSPLQPTTNLTKVKHKYSVTDMPKTHVFVVRGFVSRDQTSNLFSSAMTIVSTSQSI